jgi:hypothetical protein
MDLTELQLLGRLVEIYDIANEPHSFTVGRLDHVSEEVYLAETVSRIGQPDGFQFGFCEDVWAVGISGKYLELIEKEATSWLGSARSFRSIDDIFEWSKEGNALSFEYHDETEMLAIVLSYTDSRVTVRELTDDSDRVLVMERRGLKRLRGGRH